MRIREGSCSRTVRDRAFASIPAECRWGLPLLYLVFVLVVAALYPLCRWYGSMKARSRAGWLRYI